MQLTTFFGRMVLVLFLISCVCSVLAEMEDIHARKVKVRAKPRPKARPSVAKVKAKPKAKAAAKPKTKAAAKPKTKAAAKPKTKAAAKVAPKKKKVAPKKAASKTTTPATAKKPATKAKTPATAKKPATKAKTPATAKKPATKAPAKTAPKAKTPAKTAPKTTKTTPKGKAPAKKPVPSGGAKACPIPKKGAKAVKPREFKDEDELDAYYGIVKVNYNSTAAIRRRTLEKRTNVCGFNNLRNQNAAEAKCEENDARYVKDAAGNLVRQNGGRVAGVQCDHIIELQLVADVMQNTGACLAAERMLKAGGFKAGVAPSLGDKMQEILEARVLPTVNGVDNAVFVDSGVNQAKKSYVQQFLGRPNLPAAATVNTGTEAAAIRAYLRDPTIRAMTGRGARAIDTAISTFLDAVKREATAELNRRKAQAGASCSAAQQTKFATDESVILSEPAGSKKANFPTTDRLWTAISAL